MGLIGGVLAPNEQPDIIGIRNKILI